MSEKKAKRKPLSKRARERVARQRRDPFGRLCQEVGRYLALLGWDVRVMGEPTIRGNADGALGGYEFAVRFSGRREVGPPVVPPRETKKEE